MGKRILTELPPHYGGNIDELVNEYAAELKDYVLAMVEVAECEMPDRQHYRRPDDVLTLALEGFGRRLSERMKNRRESQDLLDGLKTELNL